MGVLDRFERGVENMVSGVFAKTGRAGVKPVELVGGLKKESDARAAVVDRHRTVTPNEYQVRLSPDDLAEIDEWGREALAQELVDALRDHADAQRYAFVGGIEVEFIVDPSLSPGRYAITSRTRRGPAAPATAASHDSRHPLLDIDGKRYHLTGESTVIGRGPEADITVADSGVSREHIRLEKTDYGTILTDLGSTNGTYVEDQKVAEATLLDGNVITIGRTTIMYWDGLPANEDA